MFTSRTTLKWRNMERFPHASLCVDSREVPYKSVIMDGSIEEVDRSLYDLVLSMAIRYYGDKKGYEFSENYRHGAPGVVIFRLVPRHIASFLSEE